MSRYPGRILSSTAPTVNANTAKGIWTLDEALRYSRAGQWPVPTGGGDPFFQYNTMLLPGQGTNGAQNNTFLDSSTNNFTITRNGNTTQGTFTPFSGADGYWSNYFAGASSPAISLSGNSAFAYGTGAFTVEAWVNLYTYQSGSFAGGIVFSQTTNGTNYFMCTTGGSGEVAFTFATSGGGTTISSAAGLIPLNKWTHIAWVRSSTSAGDFKIYVNGALVATGTVAQDFTDTSFAPTIGNYTHNYVQTPFSGYISNFRVVKGTAVYTTAFTPSTTPLTAISGTSLLTCQSNRFKDNSSNGFALSANSAVSVTPFQPFSAPTNSYSASTIGGSAYSDGSGDYLTVASNANLTLGSSDFTIELWWYPLAFNSDSEILTMASSGGTNRCFAIYSNASNGTLLAFAGTGSTSWDIVSALSMGTARQNAWNHIAFTRSGSTFSTYLNGARIATTTATGTLGSSGLGILANNSGTSQAPSSYISGVRTIKGTALYTGTTYTVPTEPPTAVANTNFLANFTNAGIIDNAQKNDLETVGGAQISTSQYKWGASSMYFDGNGDNLRGPSTSDLNCGTGDFTLEGWVYVSSRTTNFPTIVGNNNGSYSPGALAFCNSSAANASYNDRFCLNVYDVNATGAPTLLSPATNALNTWYHVAIVRVGTTLKMFVNGNQVASTTISAGIVFNWGKGGVLIGGGNWDTTNSYFHGYINDLRLTKGYARYPYNFTAPTAALPLFYQAASTPSADPYFDYTTLLLPGNGTNGAQNNTFLDSSTNAFTITRNGNPTQGTFTPFSQTGWSNNFNGSSWFTNGTTISLGTNDFCMEAWYFGTGGDLGIISQRTSGQANGWSLNSGKFVALVGGSWLDPLVGNASFGVANQWTHVAVTRSGTAFRLFVNGVLVSYATASGSIADQNIPTVGAASAGGEGPFNGYISNLRVCNGSIPTSYQTSATAVGTIVFTPPTTAVTTTSQGAANVTYLTCQSNRFVDNSSVARTLTFNGTPTVQAFSPYSPTASYSTSVVGGSGYFDGTGDYLTTPATSNLEFGSGDFTIEFWWYPTSTGRQFLYHGSVGADWSIGIDYSSVSSNQKFGVWASSNGSSWNIWNSDAGGNGITGDVVPQNQWNHFAWTRSGSTWRAFLNGVQTWTGTSSASIVDRSASTKGIGTWFNASYIGSSYLSGFRIVKGTAVYTSNFTVPTAPPTAITNTQLLLSGTNGGITDATAKNNLETVGNASISTAQSKFGGSSMYFDGSGDYLDARLGPVQVLGGDFTVEMWVNPSTITGSNRTFLFLENGSNSASFFMYGATGYLAIDIANVATYNLGSTAVTTGSWQHIAFVRYGTTVTAYINGVSVGTATVSASLGSSGIMRIGAGASAGSPYFGYINDMRVTRGIARYTQNFTPPTTAFLTL